VDGGRDNNITQSLNQPYHIFFSSLDIMAF
jgi:hypothetical protein